MDNRFVFASGGHGGFPAFRNRFAMPGTNASLWVALPEKDKAPACKVLDGASKLMNLELLRRHVDRAYPLPEPQSRLQRSIVARLPRPDRAARSRVLDTPAGTASLLENLQLTPEWKKSLPLSPDFLDYHSMWLSWFGAAPPSAVICHDGTRTIRVERQPTQDMFISQKF